MEQQCITIISDILSKPVDISTSLLEIGADSMLLQEICNQIEEQFQVKFKVRELIRLEIVEEIIEEIHSKTR
jgi:acyl carrier protein